MKPKTCKRCPTLLTSRKRIVWGEKYVTQPVRKLPIMVITEAPGHEGDTYGRPLIGASGQEGRHNLDINGISSRGVWLDSICKCKSEGNRDPSPDEIRRCTEAYLIPKILELEPEYIISMGAGSTKWFLGNNYTNMELLHGIPQTVTKYGHTFTLIPTYHPAMGLHSPANMLNFQLDMKIAGNIIRGELSPYPPTDKFAGKENYVELESAAAVKSALAGQNIVAVDTETIDEGTTGWCLSFSAAPGEAYVAKATSYCAIEAVNAALAHPATLTILHNALYDLPVLAQMKVYPTKWADTMVMAYLLQSEPQGLKSLASRYCGMEMVAYSDVVGEATYHKALKYLIEVATRNWRDPDPVLEWKDGEPHVRQPQNIKGKVLRILAGVAGKGDVPYEKWKAVKDGKEIVESALGRFIPGELCDVDPDVAIFYAARDADATIRIFPILQKRIESLGLEDTLKRDMRMIPMVVDMMKAGMPIVPEKFAELSKYFQQQMDLYQRKIQHIAGKHFDGKRINPGSHPQMATLVYDKLKLHKKGGEFKAKRSKGKGKSTAEEVLKRYVDIDPIVTDILTWRGYQKLRGTYSEAIPKLADADNRVRCDMRITRAATGRLSAAKPNLMAVPVRSDEGRMIREGFVASKGRVLVAGDYCLTGDTEIITTTGNVRIDEIEVGAGVLSHSGGRELCIRPVTASACVGYMSVYEITLEDGSKVRATEDHRWKKLDESVVYTRDLMPGDRMLHVRSGYSGRYPTWYLKSNRDYTKKHIAVCEFRNGDRPEGYHVDHIDGNQENWHVGNLRYLEGKVNYAQGGRRYWRDVKNGNRTDDKRLKGLRVGLENRRSYVGEGNPNFGKRKGGMSVCAVCGVKFYAPPCRKAKYCSQECYVESRRVNHKIVSVKYIGVRDVYQITVEDTHNYVLANGLVSLNSQVEMRVLANASLDESMLKVFWAGEDLHAQTASWMFDLPVDKLDSKKHRYPAKRIGFGIVYMITAQGLQRELAVSGLDWSVRECENQMENWFGIFSGVRKFMKKNGKNAKRYGYVRDMYGRIRFIPGIRSTNKWIRLEAERQAGNAPIQMGAQGVMKEAMGRLVPVYRELQEVGYINPLLQIHDDIVWEMDEFMVPVAMPRIKEVMENAAPKDFLVPTPVDFKIGKTWGSMEDYDS